MKGRDKNMIDRIWSMSDRIALSCQEYRLVTLEEIAQYIRNGDAECIESLAHTIRSCMAARHMRLHVEAVTKLNYQCKLIRARLRELDFSGNSDLEALFEQLNQYATTELRKQLN
jgi:hypothetical protein